MERRKIKNNSGNNNAYYTTASYPDLLDLVAEKQPALSIGSSPSFNTELFLPSVPLSHAHSEEVWSHLRIASGNKGPLQSQCGNRNGSLLPSQACFNYSSHQCYPKFHWGRYVDSADSTYGSHTSSVDAQSVDDSLCPRESKSVARRSPSVTSSSRLSWVEDHAARIHPLGFNLMCPLVDGDESLVCPLCPWVGSTPSEKRKHDARHKKTHICEICAAGFGTQNDLERHRKARHQKTPRCGPSERFKCFGRSCRNPDKLWPRRDNFKAHIQRRHKDENQNELMRLSKEWYEENKYMANNNTEEEIKVKETSKDENNKPTKLDTFVDDGVTSRKRLKDEDASITVPEETTKSSQADEILLGKPPNYSHRSDVKLPSVESVLNSNHLQEPDSSEEQKTGALPSMRSLERGVALMEALALQKLRTQASPSQQQKQQTSPETNLSGASLHRNPQGNLPSVGNFSEKERVFWLNIVTDMRNELTHQTPHNVGDGNANKQRLEYSSLKKSHRASYACSECEKTFGRQCDLKKHMARHEKRYGCTFTDCFRVFGSKADWQRHENTQHFHSRSFRCFLPDTAHKECAKLFLREEKYREHLSEYHSVNDIKDIDSYVSKNQIGKNGQTQYWCGFCRQIKRLKTKGLDAWKERFDHIDSEHFRQGQMIGDWLPPSGHMVKRDLEILQRGNNKKKQLVNQDELVSDSHDEIDSLSSENFTKSGRYQSERETAREKTVDMSSGNDSDSASEMTDALDSSIRSPSISPEDSRKRKARDFCSPCNDDYSVQDIQYRWNKVIYCCRCGDGPASGATNTHCPNCSTEFCCFCHFDMESFAS